MNRILNVKTLDVVASHRGIKDCPMRIAQDGHGNWYCTDCGIAILCKIVEAVPKEDVESYKFGKCEYANCRAVSHQVNHGYCPSCAKLLGERLQNEIPTSGNA